MPNTFLPTVLRRLRKLLGKAEAQGVTDGQLLERFITQQEPDAFTALMVRHGGMVLGVARRIVAADDADDVFQATFLLLIRKATSIHKQQSVASWLHGVAYRLALKSRGQTVQRRSHELRAGDMRQTEPTPEASPEAAWQELRQILDEELQRLPEKYRLPLVHCYLEDQTHEDSAAALGWPVGTVKSRLARGRERLRKGLTRRGLTLSAGGLAATLAVHGHAAAAIAPGLSQSTAEAATLAAAGKTLVGAVSAKVLALMEGAVTVMATSKLKLALYVFILLGLLAGGGGAIAWHARGNEADEPRPAAAPANKPEPAAPPSEARKVLSGKKPPAPAKEDAQERKALEGVWTAVDLEVAGVRKLDRFETHLPSMLQIDGGTASFLPGNLGAPAPFDHDAQATFRIDTTPKPNHIDFAFTANADKRKPIREGTLKCLYERDGNRLKLSFNGLNDDRPAGFAGKPETPQETWTFQRYEVKKPDPREALLGSWYLVAWEGEGARTWDEPIKFEWTQDKLSWTFEGKKHERRYEFSPNDETRQFITFTTSEGKKLQGLCSPRGDTLWLCEAIDEGIARPADFAAAPFTTLKFFRRQARPNERHNGLRATIDAAAEVSAFDPQIFVRLFLHNASDKAMRIATYWTRKDETIADGYMHIKFFPVPTPQGDGAELIERITAMNIVTLEPGKKHQIETTIPYEQFTLREALTVSCYYAITDGQFITKHNVWSGEIRSRPALIRIKQPPAPKEPALPGKWIESRRFTWPEARLRATALSADGNFLAAAGDRPNGLEAGVRVWNVRSEKVLMTAWSTGKLGSSRIGSVAISPSGKYVAALGGGGFVDDHLIVWEVAGGKEILNQKGIDGAVLAFAPGDKILAIGGQTSGAEKNVALWEVENGKQKAVLDGSRISQVEFTSDGKAVAGWSPQTSTWALFDVASGRKLPEPEYLKATNALTRKLLQQVKPPWAPRVAVPETIANTRFFNIFDAASGKKIARAPAVEKEDLMFSADGALLASIRFDYIDLDSRKPHTTLILRSGKSGRALETLQLPGQRFAGFSSRNHAFLTTSHAENTIRLWEPDKDAPPQTAVSADPLAALPKSSALAANIAWHKKIGPREIRMSWFLQGDSAIAMICQVDLAKEKVYTAREVFEHATQAEKTHRLTHNQAVTLRKLARALPGSQKNLDAKNVVLVSIEDDGERRTFLYDRLAPPPELVRLYDLTGAYLETEGSKDSK